MRWFVDRRLDGHMLSTINRREPTIRSLAREYNKCCDAIVEVIAKREAPRGSRAPPKVDVERLFALDVDEDIWQDIGLEEDSTESALWQTDPQVRQGIRQMQELDRCKEEEARLAHERASLQEWIADEWNAIENAITLGGTCHYDKKGTEVDAEVDSICEVGILHQLELRKRRLCRLVYLWQNKAEDLRTARDIGTWGPSEEEIADAGHEEHTEDVNREVEEDDEDDAHEDYAVSDDEDRGDAEMDADLAGAFDDAELWFGQELMSATDELALTDIHSSPSHGSRRFFASPSRGSENLFVSPLREDPDELEDGRWPTTPSRTARAGSNTYGESGRSGWPLGNVPRRTH